MKAKFKIFALKCFMELSGFSRFALKDKIFFNKCLDLFFRSDFCDILSNIDKRPIEFEFVIHKLWKDEF